MKCCESELIRHWITCVGKVGTCIYRRAICWCNAQCSREPGKQQTVYLSNIGECISYFDFNERSQEDYKTEELLDGLHWFEIERLGGIGTGMYCSDDWIEKNKQSIPIYAPLCEKGRRDDEA